MSPRLCRIRRRFRERREPIRAMDVSWSAPSNTGRPPIRAYDLQYRDGPSGNWVDLVEELNVNTSTTLTGLRTVKSYQVRVRAANDEGDGEWSAPGSERANVAPTFGEEETSRRVAETEGDSTEAAPRNLGAVVTATDTDRDTLSYSLGGGAPFLFRHRCVKRADYNEGGARLRPRGEVAVQGDCEGDRRLWWDGQGQGEDHRVGR